MQKKLIAAVVVAALSPAAALADSANVELYGAVGQMVEMVEAKGATAANKDRDSMVRVSDMSSRFGLRGSETLGDGLKAIWQIEQKVVLDDGSAGAFANRNSFIGLQGGFGALRVGTYDAPYKDFGGELDVLEYSNASPYGKVWSRFEQRAKNTINYQTPDMSGLQIKAAYILGENKGKDASDKSYESNAISLAATYAIADLKLGLGYESRKDTKSGNGYDPLNSDVSKNTTEAGSDTKAMKLMASYTLGNLLVGGGFEQTTWTPNSGPELKQAGLLAAASFAVTPAARLALSYAAVGKLDGKMDAGVDTADDYKVNQISLGLTYDLSKRTRVTVFASKINNEKAAKADFSGIGISPDAGADPQAFGVGLRHKF